MIYFTTILLVVLCAQLSTSTETVQVEPEDRPGLENELGFLGTSAQYEEADDQLPKRSRDVFNFMQARPAPSVRQDIYNFYNVRPTNRQRQTPRPRPEYNDYDQDNQYNPYYQQRPPYQPVRPYPPYPYYLPTPHPPEQQSSSPSSEPPTQSQDPTKPIGYMLMDTYRSPFRSFSRPVAFFTS